jgi:hypothetical protein
LLPTSGGGLFLGKSDCCRPLRRVLSANFFLLSLGISQFGNGNILDEETYNKLKKANLRTPYRPRN